MRASDTWLAEGARTVRGPLALSISFGIVSGILILAQTAVVVGIVNAAVFESATLQSLAWNFVAAFLLFCGRAVTAYASERIGFSCAAAVKSDVRQELRSKIAALGPVWLVNQHAGELATTIVDGVENLEPYYARYLPQRAVSSILPLLFLAVTFPVDLISGIIFAGTAVFLPVLMILIGEEARSKNQRQWLKVTTLSARFLDIVQGILTLKIFRASRREVETIRRLSEDNRLASMGVVRTAFVSSLMLELITTVSIALVAITTGFRLLDGSLDFHRAYFVLLLAPEFYQPLRSMGTHYHARMSAAAVAERIHAILSEPDTARTPETTEGPPEAAAIESAVAPGRIARSGAAPPEQSAPPRVEFRDVRFAYATRKAAANVLDGFTLVVEAGEHVAIGGESGAGKSTIISLLLGFISPVSGSVIVDDTPVAGAHIRSLWTQSAWMPQRPTIFPGSVRDNIALGMSGATQHEITEAAKSAHADDFIVRLPDGYDTVLGERGYGISGGEIQRIALARLFLRKPRLVILDEPGAHLDAASEGIILDSIRTLSRGRTMVVVSHRSTVGSIVDRSVTIENGRIAGVST